MRFQARTDLSPPGGVYQSITDWFLPVEYSHGKIFQAAVSFGIFPLHRSGIVAPRHPSR